MSSPTGLAEQIAAAEQIASEIKALRKGRGIRTAELGRVGPLLHELIGEAAGRDAATMRLALAGQLERAAGRLPGELRTAILAAIGMQPETRDMRTYEERKSWVANQLDRVPRTAERRIGEALSLLAVELAAELLRRRETTAAAQDGWYVSRFEAVLLLDGESIEAIERRRIVATSSGLQEITISLDIPDQPGEPRQALQQEVMYGGTLIAAEQTRSQKRSRLLIRLPTPLQSGETHEYAIRMRALASPDLRFRPYYIFTPDRRCDMFDLRVRFAPARLPEWVRRVDGETLSTSEDAAPTAVDTISIDSAGEVHLQFRYPQKYLGYGVVWAPGLAGG